MDPAAVIRDARLAAGITQQALAERAGTSQATISAYESGAKQPSVATLTRIMAAVGWGLIPKPSGYVVTRPSPEELKERGRILRQVLDFAETFPSRRVRERADLRYPPLPR